MDVLTFRLLFISVCILLTLNVQADEMSITRQPSLSNQNLWNSQLAGDHSDPRSVLQTQATQAHDGLFAATRYSAMSLDELVKAPPVNKDLQSALRKALAKDRFYENMGNPNFPGIQVYREFLIRENIGAQPSVDYFTVRASEPFVDLEQWAELSDHNQEVIRFWENLNLDLGISVESGFKVIDATKQTRNPGNTENMYGGNYNYSNSDNPAASGGFTRGDRERMRAETADCDGEQSITKGMTVAERESVMNCFEKFDLDFYKALGYQNREGMSIYKAMDYVTALVDDAEAHICMASIYKNNVWITARHCVTDKKIANGLYIIINNNKVAIKNDDIVLCSGLKCDIAAIKLPTPNVPADLSVDRFNSVWVTHKTPIFIPGIEAGMPNFSEGNNQILNNLMWSHVGKGYCNAYKIESGCMSHTCSTLTGFSGAPIYMEGSNKKIMLVGVHSGAVREAVSCKVENTNYATSSLFFASLDRKLSN
jgi:hypothetical protein